jgi:hypothetical protein
VSEDRGADFIARHAAGETWVSIARSEGTSNTRVHQLARRASRDRARQRKYGDVLGTLDLPSRLVWALWQGGYRNWDQFHGFTPGRVREFAGSTPQHVYGFARASAEILIGYLRQRDLLNEDRPLGTDQPA